MAIFKHSRESRKAYYKSSNAPWYIAKCMPHIMELLEGILFELKYPKRRKRKLTRYGKKLTGLLKDGKSLKEAHRILKATES